MSQPPVSPRAARFTWRALLAVLAAGLLAVTGIPARAQTFDAGHVDAFYVTAPGGTLTLSMKEDITGHNVERPGDDVVLRVSEAAWSEVTEQIGGIGTPAYYLPQTQDAALLWPGWDTQPAQDAGFKSVDLHFLEVTGPGAVYGFETVGFGDTRAVTTSGDMEIRSGSVISQPYPAHRHIAWAFTEPGTYTMTVEARSNGTASNAVTYTWSVGDGSAAGAANEDSEDADSEYDAADDDAAGGDDAGAEPDSGKAGSGAAPATRGAQAQAGRTAATTSAAGRATAEHGAPAAGRAHSTQAAGAATDASPSPTAYAEGTALLPWGLGMLGLGMLAMGLGIGRLALAKAKE